MPGLDPGIHELNAGREPGSLFEKRTHRWPPSHLDKIRPRDYPCFMNIVRRTLDIDSDTDTRLREMADERGQDVAAVLAEAVALLDSVVDIAGPDIAEDRRRLDAFKQTRAAVPLDEVKTWVASWGSANELPRPAPRKIG
jgi:predicted transcriptional regulator